MTEPLTLRLRGLDDLPVLVPHLVGFHPDDSLVLIGLRGERSRVVVTVRVDLPSLGEELEDSLARVEPALHGLAHAGADEVILVIYPHPRDEPWADGRIQPLPHHALVGEVAALLCEAGVRIRDIVCIGEHRQASYLCTDPACCPPEGRTVDPVGSSLVQATFVGAGSAPLDSREALVAQLEPRPADDPVLVAVRRAAPGVFLRLAAGLPERSARFVEDLRRWDGAARDHAARTRLVATSGHLVTTIPSRDLLLRALTADADHHLLALARDVLAEAVRCAPSGEVAALAAVLAVCCWVDGDGAAAWVALDRATDDDPQHSLAGLVTAALLQGHPPWIWTSIMAELTDEAILAAAGPDPERSAG